MALRHIALRTRDLEQTRRFYIDHLGLREAFTHPGSRPLWVIPELRQ